MKGGNLSPKPRCNVCKNMYAPSSPTAERCKCRGTSPTTTLSSVSDSLRSTGNVSDSLKSTGSVSSNENGATQKRVSGE